MGSSFEHRKHVLMFANMDVPMEVRSSTVFRLPLTESGLAHVVLRFLKLDINQGPFGICE